MQDEINGKYIALFDDLGIGYTLDEHMRIKSGNPLAFGGQSLELYFNRVREYFAGRARYKGYSWGDYWERVDNPLSADVDNLAIRPQFGLEREALSHILAFALAHR